MVKFTITIKDEFSNVSIEGDSENEVLERLHNLNKLKTDSDKILGFDIKIPKHVRDKMKSLDYSEQIMAVLYYKGDSMTRLELRVRSTILFIKDSWWGGSNFSRDLEKKITKNLISKTSDKDPKYKLTTTGVNFIRKIILKEKNG